MCLALNYEGCGKPAKDTEVEEDRISEDLEEKDLIELDSEKILFSHSFEKNENDILKTDAVIGAAGLAKAGTTLCLDDDRTMFVDKTKLFGSADNGNESKDKLFDEKTNTKFLTFITPTEEKPVEVGFEMKSACKITNYIIASANDEPSRDPAAWKFYGSENGEDWTLLDERKGIGFTGRFEKQFFSFENEEKFTYYKLVITQNKGGANCTQFASLEVGNGGCVASEEADRLELNVVNGPVKEYGNQSGKAWNGTSSLEAVGYDLGQGKTFARHVLFEDLSIKVDSDTFMSYMILPSAYSEGGYDYSYLNMHFVIDLEFTDGTRLSELKAKDGLGTEMNPDAQAESCKLYSNQWNKVTCKIGEVAAEKTIDKVVLYYENSQKCSPSNFRTYFDDLKIYDAKEKTYAHLTDYVNILRGTNATGGFSRGLTCPGVTLPQGFNFMSPITAPGSGQPYYYSADTDKLYCLSVEHVASNWVGDHGTWGVMASTTLNAEDVLTYEDITLGAKGRQASLFKHENENAKAHYYSVKLEEGTPASGVNMETTVTDHGIYVRMLFPKDAENTSVLFDCYKAEGSFRFREEGAVFNAVSDDCARGSNQLFVYGEFVDCKPVSTSVIGHKGAIATFEKGTTEVTFKFATSYISNEQAKHNLELEIPAGKKFDDVLSDAQSIWEKKLGTVEIPKASEEELITFYSSMYRLFAYPTSYWENEGTNEKEKIVHAEVYNGGKVKEGYLYANNGFWDTYRTAWAAYYLFMPTGASRLLNGIVQHAADNNGWVPRWIAPAGTNSMVGTNSDVVFADAIAKGILFDDETAYRSALQNGAAVSPNLTNGGRAGLDHSIFLGYMPLEDDQGLSWGMEGYINDYGVAMMALARGDRDIYEYYINRCRYYVNYFDEAHGFFIGKNKKGDFRYAPEAQYDPHAWWGDYTETSGWCMAFSVPFDGNGLAALYGGRKALKEKLDEAFGFAPSDLQVGNIHEMVEARELRLGEFHLSNQPAHHMPYMYAYAGAPYKTAEVVRKALNRCFTGSAIGQGYPGDEDNGEMSGWYILSALGLYPLNMGSGEYIITTPLFESYTLHLESGDIKVSCRNFSEKNIYIEMMILKTKDGKEINYTKNYITHKDLLNTTEIVYVLSDRYDENGWGTAENDLPTSVSESAAQVPQPAIDVTKGIEAGSGFNAELAGTRQLWTSADPKDAAKLFDDTSNSKAVLKGDTSVYIYDPKGTEVRIYTVSCVEKKNMPSEVGLYGSNDGESWVELDRRTGVTALTDRYTQPFAVAKEKQGVYKYYRLDISAGTVAELELLGTDK
jgi:predicted alpha-1,2-mannosidase